MSRSQWLISALLVWFVTALLVAAIPRPDALPSAQAMQNAPAPNTFLARQLSRLATSAYALCGVLWRWSAPVRPVTSEVLARYGLAQRWDMFAAPPRHVDYVRARYYLQSGVAARSTLSYSELIFPELPQNKVRLVRSFSALHRDQVIMAIITRYHPGSEIEAASDEYRSALRSVARYFAERYQRKWLKPTDRIVRVELWHGAAGIAAPPDAVVQDAERLTTLVDYYASPIERRIPQSAFPQVSAREQEGDIGWILEFVEDR